MGCRSKRKPGCNGPDRDSNFAPPRKGADFRQVLDHEKGTERLNRRGYFRRCVPLAALKARWALCVSSVQPRIAKAAGIDRRVLHGALSRLEPGAGKLARRVLSQGDGDVTRLPDWRAAEEALTAAGESTKVIDLGGAFAMPGLIDVHTHPITTGIDWSNLALSDPTNVDAILAEVRAFAEANKDLPVIRGGSWNRGVFENDSPRKELGFFRDCARKKRFSFGEQRTARCRGCSAKYGAMLDL